MEPALHYVAMIGRERHAVFATGIADIRRQFERQRRL